MALKFTVIMISVTCDICTREFKVKFNLKQEIMGAVGVTESSVAYHTRTKQDGDDVYHRHVCWHCRISLRAAIESEEARLKREFIRQQSLEENYEVVQAPEAGEMEKENTSSEREDHAVDSE